MATKKTTKPVEIDEMGDEERRNRLFEATRRIMLASVGAVAWAQDEAKELLNMLVERGEMAEKDARKILREVTNRRTKAAERELDHRFEDVLDRLNIPTKSDIESLSEKIAALTEKVEAIKSK